MSLGLQEVDGIKFWAASPNSWTTTVTMPIEVTRPRCPRPTPACFCSSHEVRGVRVAAETGVDVLAHTSSNHTELWDDNLVRKMRTNNVALIPTLKLYLCPPSARVCRLT